MGRSPRRRRERRRRRRMCLGSANSRIPPVSFLLRALGRVNSLSFPSPTSLHYTTIDADNDDPDSDDEFGKSDRKDSDDEKDDAAGLFDSSSEDEGGGGTGATKKKKLGKKRKPKQDKRSMKERMEALAKKRHAGGSTDGTGGGAKEPRKKRSKPDKESGGDKKAEGYESGDSYDSATFKRTKDDDDFIDADGEDPDALKELYAEQHFDDERPDGSDSEDEAQKKKSKGSRKSAGGGLDKINLDDDVGDETADATSALVAAVKRMAKKKKETKKLPELELEATEFLKEMDAAADADDQSIANRKPATKKLGMLPKVLETLAKKDMQRPLLDLDLLSVAKRWVQPLPSGSLGNVTLRKAIFEAIAMMTGENGVNSGDLKRSGFGKVTMALYMHKSETPAMKRLLKSLIDQWSRPIFQKSGDMRDLEKIQAARGLNESGSLVGIARSAASQRKHSPGGSKHGKTEDELAQIISEGSKNARESGNNRVRVPYSKGFQFSVRPTNRTGDVSDKRNLVSASGKVSMGADGEKRNALSKRMMEKNRPVNKQSQRSANISIEGRAAK
ncbi:hypothetical protein HJC23_013031 [Cyclotella cryptica]|uniref:TFIIS N-terminal domain-containing protein n=1 Tax=Cyclotella cryptica TaxID=29204 RepID=A0ABD3QHJ7_9STRA